MTLPVFIIHIVNFSLPHTHSSYSMTSSYLNNTPEFEDSTDNLSLHTPSSQGTHASELDDITLEDLQPSPIEDTESTENMEQNPPTPPTADEAGRSRLRTLLTLRAPRLAETVPNPIQMHKC